MASIVVNVTGSSLVNITCIDVSRTANICTGHNDNTTTRVNIRNNKTAIGSIVVNVTCIAFDAVPIVEVASYMIGASRTANVDVTCIDVAHNNKTAIGIVNVPCIAFDAIPIVGVASYTPP